ncbi:alpha/beta hydrolase [Massilia sp.]|uniref:alpha/beta fold hydrolase n=1 Tax=Massilia sp. TaxID=1882437 RepID=UPI002899E1CA|nr:alpha/beta hydrolase [Massilia sp.]
MDSSARAAIAGPNLIRTRGVDLFYRDWGGGAPLLFVAGWSMPSDSWSRSMLALGEAGYRALAFDRRGHGRSSDPGAGYDFDTLADDLAAVIEALELHDVVLVGHSMGCNEIVRYLSRHGSARVRGAALVGTMTPFLLRSGDNPHGIDGALLDAVRREQLMADFPRWIDDNLAPFVTPDTPQGTRDWLRAMAHGASLHALCACQYELARTDFRAELRGLDLPVLLVAGTDDASAPLALTAQPSARLLPQATLHVIDGAPHGLFLTHRREVEASLLEFLGRIGHNPDNPAREP